MKENDITEEVNESELNSGEFPMIAKTMAELEDVLAEELIELGANNVEIGTRMVSFTGDKSLMYKANLHCRTALRILKPIYNFKAETADEVYEAIKQLNWDDFLSLDKTFSIDAVVFSHIFTHSKFVAYKVKDAIADWFMERYEKRPSVSVSNPDLIFNIHISHNKCTLSLDSSGESLHKRGYRVDQTEAPLSEVLAAGMILKSGWRGESTFIDPMCGSGTILIEAAMIALGIPPGIHRQHFAFEKWKDFDSDLFSDIYNEDTGLRELKFPIIGSDISAKAISIAEKNIKNAGLKKYIELSVKPFQQYTKAPAESGVLITNPPYGERIKVEELEVLYSSIGERLKHAFSGFKAFILSYHKESFDAIGLKHTRRFFLYNGPLECEMREYEIFSGKRNEQPRDSSSHSKANRRDSYHNERNSREGYRRSRRGEQEESDNKNRREVSGDHKDRRPRERSERGTSSDWKPRASNSENRGYRERENTGGRSFDARSKDRPRKPYGESGKEGRSGRDNNTGREGYSGRGSSSDRKGFSSREGNSGRDSFKFKKEAGKRGSFNAGKPKREGEGGKKVLKLRGGSRDKG